MVSFTKTLQSIGSRTGRALLPFEIIEIVEKQLTSHQFMSECTPSYLTTIRKFISDHVAGKLAQLRKGRGMYDALEREEEWDEETDLSLDASGVFQLLQIQNLQNLSH